MGGTGKLKNVPRRFFLALAAAFALQLLFWSQTRNFAPPVIRTDAAPSPAMARIAALGDVQFYYRAAGLGLQTMGDWAGQLTPLKQYDYGRLAGWFTLLSQLDPRSHYVPSLAAYYFGLSHDPSQVRQVIGYLRHIGVENPQQNWNFLAYAVYLARYRVKDTQLALELAGELAALKAEGLPAWTRQLPAFVLADAGEKEAARTILEAILASTPDLDPAEQYFIRDYITRRLTIPDKPE
jgi:hypothetical protein